MTCEMCQNSLKIDKILQELSELRAILTPKRCSEADVAVLSRLLPAIGGKFGSAAVRTAEILRDPALRVICGSPGATGSLLSRAADDEAVIVGYQVIRAKKEGNAVLWSVVRTLPQAFDSKTRGCSNGSGSYSNQRRFEK